MVPPLRSALSDSDMDDEIDVFHKQRDIVPLDLDNDAGDSDEDNDQHVFELEDSSDDEDEDEDEDDSEEDIGFAAKIAKQQKSLRAKIGGAEDETQEDAEDEDEEKKRVGWGRDTNSYYENNEGNSSDYEEEEEEVLRLLNKKTKLYSNADHGLEDDSEEEPTFENMSKEKGRSKVPIGHDDQDETEIEVVTKDLNALSKEEQMDIVYNSAPELVGLLSELNEAVEQLETKVDPILNKLKEEKNTNKNGVQYMELKKQLLLSYCQAISFHLLLKSEGHPVRDHPVLARLVEIKNLLDKMKPLDENLLSDIEVFLKDHATVKMVDSLVKTAAVDSISLTNSSTIIETQQEPCVEPKKDSTMNLDNGGKRKRENERIGLQSVEMFKVRAALEEKLKRKGLLNLKATKTNGTKKNVKPLNGKLEARDDFDDDAIDIEGNQNKSSSRPSQLVTQIKKPRVISGDDDIPKRDDIGERRRKHEMRVLTNAGFLSDDDFQENDHDILEGDDDEDGDTDSESDLYKQTKIKRDARLAAKSQKYSRIAPSVLAAPETELEGKRQINYEMEKNKGLTRKRNKDKKNPRKKYRLNHKKKEIARKGQVRGIRKPAGPYGGEGSGINTISRSIRFKS
ncbi:hypothetical protein E3N88_07725 [Mikania micrantha]|uniref:Sas10 C-terminal domain-containing protein n=1 Tax=Mikania micrantha TaxID=192012 RepID=A0A5N6PE52_9ASTR|nr:hypothetical protein E3N88_07725 [Mikania micrantha]